MNERADLGVDQVTLSLVLSGRLNRALDSGRIGPPRDRPLIKSLAMSTIRTKDGTQLHYNDWGAGQRVVASHGWPLSADAFEDQMFFLASRGFRCIAHDRRGHGRSSQPWNGNDLETYAIACWPSRRGAECGVRVVPRVPGRLRRWALHRRVSFDASVVPAAHCCGSAA